MHAPTVIDILIQLSQQPHLMQLLGDAVTVGTLMGWVIHAGRWIAENWPGNPGGAEEGMSNSQAMSEAEKPEDVIPVDDPSGVPRLVTITEAAALTGLSRKALTRRVERGTLRSVKDAEGRRVVPRAELQRSGLLTENGQAGNPGGELVVWRDLYERERQERERADARANEFERDLVAIANAGPIRAMRLRRQLRQKLA